MNEVKDRLVQYPRRFRMVDLGDGVIELTPEPGTIQEEGTPIDKALFDSIKTDFMSVNEDISNLDSTKANLTQVVRTDTSQSLSASQQLQASKNIGHNFISYDNKNIRGKGWFSVATAEILNGASGIIVIKQAYNSISPTTMVIAFSQTGYNPTSLSLLSSQTQNSGFKFRYIHGGSGTSYFQIYIPYSESQNNDWFVSVICSQKGGVMAEINTVADSRRTPSDNISAEIDIPVNGSSLAIIPMNPTFTSGTSGRLRLPDKGWYYLKASETFHFGLVYWDGETLTRTPCQIESSTGNDVSTVASIWISTLGIISLYINTTQNTSTTVYYCKIA